MNKTITPVNQTTNKDQDKPIENTKTAIEKDKMAKEVVKEKNKTSKSDDFDGELGFDDIDIDFEKQLLEIENNYDVNTTSKPSSQQTTQIAVTSTAVISLLCWLVTNFLLY